MKIKTFRELTLKEYESFTDDIENFIEKTSNNYHLSVDETEDEIINAILSHFEC